MRTPPSRRRKRSRALRPAGPPKDLPAAAPDATPDPPFPRSATMRLALKNPAFAARVLATFVTLVAGTWAMKVLRSVSLLVGSGLGAAGANPGLLARDRQFPAAPS